MAAVAVAGILLLAPPSGAEETAARTAFNASAGTVTITAPEMAFSNADGRISFSGGVTVTQADITLSADRIDVVLATPGGEDAADRIERPAGEASANPAAEPRIRRMEAQGQVHFRHGDRVATAGRAVYNPDAGTVVLTEHPVVSDRNMELVGERITLDLASEQSRVEGGSFTFNGGTLPP